MQAPDSNHSRRAGPVLRLFDATLWSREQVDAAVVGIGGLWAAVVFAGWDGLQWIVGVRSQAGNTSFTPAEWSEFASWQLLSAKVADGNLFPVLASIDAQASGLSFYPYLSIWVHGLLIKLFGLGGASIIGHVLFPAACFVLLFYVFRRHLTRRWCVALSALALVSFASAPLRDFLSGVLSGQGWRELGSIQPLEASFFPIPAFSLFAFLGLFYYSVETRHLDRRLLSILTILWALQSQVHIVNAVVGLVFWFTAFPIRLHRQNRHGALRGLAVQVGAQAALAVVVLLPAALGYLGLTGGAALGLTALDVRTEADSPFGAFYLAAYFALPLALLAVTYVVDRIDIYELFTRFWPVFVLMGAEFILINMRPVLGIGVPPDLIFTRLGMFFLHFYYFVPVLYYLAQPRSRFRAGTEAQPVIMLVRAGMSWFFNRAAAVYLVLLVAALSFFAVASMERALEHQRNAGQMTVADTRKMLESLSAGAPEGATLVADLPLVNMLIPNHTGYGTLWVNLFANAVSSAHIIEGLALYAHLVGWSEDEFIAFMSPGNLQSLKPGVLAELTPVGIGTSGVGYWLAMHNTRVDSTAAAEYAATLRSVYANLDLAQAVQKFGVRRLLSKRPPPAGLEIVEMRPVFGGTLYMIGSEGE